ncbi:2-hydroxymuconate tautomerase [Ottowia thiooxydans]|uniref:Tautomerase n=1 Tax=Ottowia thiooxydans TaxID=219182 RepID=A0ABV2Q9K4_9BURK
MPIVQIQLLEGRSEQQLSHLIKEVTEACHKTVEVPREAVRVSVIEVRNTQFGVGGKTLKELGR